MLECWNTGMLECWDAGILECWNTGIENDAGITNNAGMVETDVGKGQMSPR
jgi:hypothetical protein